MCIYNDSWSHVKPKVQCFCEILRLLQPELNHKYNQNLQKIDLKIDFYYTATLVYTLISFFILYYTFFSTYQARKK